MASSAPLIHALDTHVLSCGVVAMIAPLFRYCDDFIWSLSSD
jgi:hypothetical protein